MFEVKKLITYVYKVIKTTPSDAAKNKLRVNIYPGKIKTMTVNSAKRKELLAILTKLICIFVSLPFFTEEIKVPSFDWAPLLIAKSIVIFWSFTDKSLGKNSTFFSLAASLR